MKSSIPQASQGNLRVFIACLLTFTILMTPIAAVAAGKSGSSPTLNEGSLSRASNQASNQANNKSSAAEGLFVNPPIAPVPPSPVVTATKVGSFAPGDDVDNDGKADPGDKITYTVTINDANADAANVQFSDTIDSHTTLVPNSLDVSPLALNDTYATIGNTLLEVGPVGSPSSSAKVTVTGSVFDNDTEFLGDSFSLSKLQATVFVGPTVTASSANSGTVTMDSNGHFSYTPPAGFTGADTFTYTIKDSQNLENSATVTINVNAPKVWYVKNDAPAGGTGTSTAPFNTLAAAQTASAAGDTIYVFFGNGTTSGQNAGITLKANQRFIGEGVQLDVPVSVNGGPNPTVLRAAGSAPHITNTGGNGVTVLNISGVNIRGFDIAGNTNAINVTTNGVNSGGVTISNNVISAAGTEGIKLAGGGSGGLTLDLQSNTVTATGNGIDISGAGGGTLTITAFANNSITGNTAGTGILINTATFDANPAVGGLQAITAGVTTIGAPGNGVGVSGLVLINTTGTLPFIDLDIVADNGTGLSVTGLGAANTGITVGAGVGTIAANGGPAVTVTAATIDLKLVSITSTNSPSNGVSLTSGVNGTFSAGSSSTITNAASDDFVVGSGTANITYDGPITSSTGHTVNVSGHTGGTVTFNGAISDTGTGISLSSNTGATITFTGGLDLATGTNTAFTATGGGTVNATQNNTSIVNKINNTTGGTGVNIVNTTIGASGVTFQKITSTGGTTPGIILNATGNTGVFTVSGNASTCTGAGNCTGGSIANKTGASEATGTPGVRLNNVANVRLNFMNISGNNHSGIYGTTVNGFQLDSCNIVNNGDSNVSNPDETGVDLHELTGSLIGGANPTSITNSTISNNFEIQCELTNITGTLTDLQMSGNTISSTGASGVIGDLFQFLGQSTSTMKLTLTSGTFTGNAPATADGIFANAGGTGGMTVKVSGATFTTNNVGVNVSTDPVNLTFTFDIHNNTFTGTRSTVINQFDNGNSPFARTVNGKIQNNIIGTNGVALSGSSVGRGIDVSNEGAVNVNLLISGNTIQEVGAPGNGFEGIGVNVGLAGLATGGGATNVTITGNTIKDIANSRGLIVNDNQTTAPNFPTICANISGNTFGPNIAGQAGNGQFMRLKRLNGTFNVTQATPTGALNPAELDDANGFNDPTKISLSGTINFSQSACSQPPPLLLAPGGVDSTTDVLSFLTGFDSDQVSFPLITTSASRRSGVALPTVAPSAVVTSSLSQHELDAIVAAANQRWSNTGLTQQQIATLRGVKFDVTDLTGSFLGTADRNHILIDRNADGRGWFVGSSPLDDTSFTHAASSTRLYADPMSASAGHVDLLTAIMHEMGHRLGLDDSYAPNDRDSLMYGYLTVGERRLPSKDQAIGTQPGTLTRPHFLSLGRNANSVTTTAKNSATTSSAMAPMPSGETVNASIGSLPAGKSVTLTFKVTLNNPPGLDAADLAGGPHVRNQGKVDYTGGPVGGVPTDDPALPGATDPTDTPVDLFDTTTTVITSNASSNQGEAVTFTATVASNPSGNPTTATGTVTFSDGGTAITCTENNGDTQTLNVSGVATCTTSTLTVGVGKTIKAQYNGDGNFDTSFGTVSQTVNACTTNPVVTSTADSGPNTLRDAIQQACAGNTITFNLGAGPHTITLSSELTIQKNLTIVGPTDPLTVSGGGVGRAFLVDTGKTVSISNLTIANGQANFGGGIYNLGNLTISNSTFTGNAAVGGTGEGGAIDSEGGTLTIVNTTISGNSAETDGGGLLNCGTSTTTLTNVTITNNRADSDGNSTGDGGGIDQVSSNAITLHNTIVASNFKGTGTTASDVFVLSGSTINAASSNNLIGVDTGLSGITNGSNGNQIGTAGTPINPRLGALASNGGPTQTHALLAGSPALDAGNNTAATNAGLTTDQRGTGFARVRDAASDADTTQTVDIGAFEADPSVEDTTDKATAEDTALPIFSFNVGDAATAFDSITATSSNTTLVPNANIIVSGSGSTRSLSITPAANQSGTTTITVTVTKTVNSTVLSMSDTFLLTVGTVPDTPSVTNATTNEDTQTTSGLVITRNAADDGEITHFKITNITNGTLFKNDGVSPIANNSFITVAEGNAGLKFTPTANSFAAGSFQVQSSTDAVGTSLSAGAATATITVNAVADTPSVTNATTNEDTQTTSGLVISRNAADGAEVTHFKITGITNGTLFQNNGTTQINNGDFITFAQGNAGLKFTPAANLFTPTTTFSFTVQASTSNVDAELGGGTVNATITVTPVADTPSVTNATTSVNTQTTSGLVISRNAVDGAEVTHFKISNITNGTLFQNNGTTPINNNDFITFAQGNAGLKFTPANNFTGTGSFDVQGATDGTGSGLSSVATATITVVPTLALVVNVTGDAADANVGDGICDSDLGTAGDQCTLRAAIQETNNASGDDSIGFDPALNGGTITLDTALDAINGNLTITGPGATLLTVRRNPAGGTPDFRIFTINSGKTVTISGLTISGGNTDFGGGIANSGTLTITNSTVSGNTATGGGGIYNALSNSTATITLNSSIVSGNHAVSGAGIENAIDGSGIATLTINNSTISGNTNSGLGGGGGISNGGFGKGGSATVTINNSTISGNGAGGGIDNSSAQDGSMLSGTAARVTITNSTISGNNSHDRGGGIYNSSFGSSSLAMVTIVNGTISGNNASSISSGGGINNFVFAGTATVTLRNTIVAGNSVNSATTPDDLSGTVDPASSFNLIGTCSLCGLSDGTNNNQVGVANPRLGPLANNGGPTRTHALLAGSPALDAGNNTAAANAGLTTDQRGTGFARVLDAASDADTTQTVDIGAFEADPSVEDITDKSTNEDTALPTFSFNVGDAATAFDSITATSSNTTLVPNANIIVSGSGSTRSLSITPAANQSGTTTITVTVTKTVNSTVLSMSDTFLLTVGTVPDTPSVTNATTNEDTQTTSGLVITRNAADDGEITHFKITNITNGTLFKNDGVSPIANNSFITVAEGNAGLKFTPTTDSNASGSFQVQASLNNTNGGLGGGLATATITVNAVNDAPTLDPISNLTINEDAPLQTVNLTGITAGGGESQTLTVTATSNNTGVVPNPTVTYTSPNSTGTLTFTPVANANGSALITVTVQDNGGTANGGVNTTTRTFTVTVNAVNDAPVNTVPGAQSVTENSSLTFSAANSNQISIADIDAGAAAVRVQLNATNGTITLSGTAGLSFTVGDGTADPTMTFAGTIASINTALNGMVFTPTTGFAGAAALQIVTNDQGNSGSGGALSDTDTVNITVNEGGTLQFSSATYSVGEGGGPAIITITRTGGTAGTATVVFSTSNGTATAGSDYTAVTQTVTFLDGDTSKTVDIPITDDSLHEADETVNLTLSNAGGSGQLGTQTTAVLTILDNDSAGGIIMFSANTYTVGESDGSIAITVQRTGDTSQAATVDYATSDDSDPSLMVRCGVVNGIASSRCDFTTAIGRLSFTAGQTSKTFTVFINQDSYVEGLEALTLTLSNPGGSAVLGTPATAILQITDDATEPATNAIDDTGNFVRQHYLDFLNRETEPGGFNAWVNLLNGCAPGNTACDRVTVSQSFFGSPEFKSKGYFATRFYFAAFNRNPLFVEFIGDLSRLNGATAAESDAAKASFPAEFTQRAEFHTTFDGLSNAQYVDTLIGNTGVAYSNRDQLVAALNSATKTRAQVLNEIVEATQFVQNLPTLNRAFVLAEYFGYLRRNPDTAGFNNWLVYLNTHPGDFRTMVSGFVNSREYRMRFGTP